MRLAGGKQKGPASQSWTERLPPLKLGFPCSRLDSRTLPEIRGKLPFASILAITAILAILAILITSFPAA
jgi:hypothetical protein